MHSAAPWRRGPRTRRRAARSGRAARPPTAVAAARRRGTRRVAPTSRRHRGGSCTSVGPERRSESSDAVEVVGQPRRRIAQLHAVRAERAELHGVHEARRRLLGPALDRGRGGQPVEGGVELDGVEERRRSARTTAVRELARVHRCRASRGTPSRSSPTRTRPSSPDTYSAATLEVAHERLEGVVRAPGASMRRMAEGWMVTSVSYGLCRWARRRRRALGPPALGAEDRLAAVAPEVDDQFRLTAPSSSSLQGATPAPPRGWASGGDGPCRCRAST